MQKQTDVEFCMFCGSIDIVNVKVSEDAEKSKGVNPNLSVGGHGISIGHFETAKGSSVSFDSKRCRKCLNVNVIDSTNPSEPMIIDMQSYEIVIPFSLFNVLDLIQIKSVKDILNLINNYIIDITKHSKNYFKKGINPCRKNRVGYKLKIEINAYTIFCWVIVDIVDNKLIYRLSYGGLNIRCP